MGVELMKIACEISCQPLMQSHTLQRGIATLEAVSLLFIFLIFMGYTAGMFGIVHTGILHSIAARTYAFETFRHRNNVQYFRENKLASTELEHYRSFGFRVHGIENEGRTSEQYIHATERPLNLNFGNEIQGRDQLTHSRTGQVASQRRNSAVSVNPVWIKIQYGICIQASCGEEG